MIPHKRKSTDATENYNPYNANIYVQLLTPEAKFEMQDVRLSARSRFKTTWPIAINIHRRYNKRTLNVVIITIMKLLCTGTLFTVMLFFKTIFGDQILSPTEDGEGIQSPKRRVF